MNILLFLPGAWVMLFQIRGLGGMLESTAVIALIQVRPPLPLSIYRQEAKMLARISIPLHLANSRYQ
jgi:hypothetical protein